MPNTLPNFRNTGVVLRIVVITNSLGIFVVTSHAISLITIWHQILLGAAYLQPILFFSLLLLYALNDYLRRIPYWHGIAAILFSVGMISCFIISIGGELFSSPNESALFGILRNVILNVIIAAFLLVYFRMRTLSLSPALSEARLQALQARIRPHFLFNSINAVLAIVRNDPKHAESALEDMADLFRMAMADTQDLVFLKREIELSQRYLALEQLRLGYRLKINWDILDLPSDVLIPPLILQPLLENAVYHGIEPMHNGGEINIKLYLSGKEIHLDIYNPCQPHERSHHGNKIALANIRERLALQFDFEARYSVDTGKNYYHVHILIPYVKGGTP